MPAEANKALLFSNLLKSSAENLAWAASQVPEARRGLVPPHGLGEWSAARHIYHMMFYEQTLALPSMQQWLGAPMPLFSDDDEDAAWKGTERVEDLLSRFLENRARQLAIISKFDPSDWTRACANTVWGAVTLQWVVTKTYQHTAEHISDLLRIALFWEVFASRA